MFNKLRRGRVYIILSMWYASFLLWVASTGFRTYWVIRDIPVMTFFVFCLFFVAWWGLKYSLYLIVVREGAVFTYVLKPLGKDIKKREAKRALEEI